VEEQQGDVLLGDQAQGVSAGVQRRERGSADTSGAIDPPLELLERRAGLDADLLRGRLARRSASVHPAIRCPGRCVGPEQPREHAAD
jgi:hypothetical protein